MAPWPPPPHAATAGRRERRPAVDRSQRPTGIVAVVNGDVISRADVDNRRRLFALSTGLPITQDVWTG